MRLLPPSNFIKWRSTNSPRTGFWYHQRLLLIPISPSYVLVGWARIHIYIYVYHIFCIYIHTLIYTWFHKNSHEFMAWIPHQIPGLLGSPSRWFSWMPTRSSSFASRRKLCTSAKKKTVETVLGKCKIKQKCIYIHICIYIYVYMCIYMYIYMCVYVYIYVFQWIYLQSINIDTENI